MSVSSPSPVSPPSQYSPTECIAGIEEFYTTVGEPPQCKSYRDSGIRPSTDVIGKQFDSWGDAVRAAGYIPRRNLTADETAWCVWLVSKRVSGRLTVAAYNDARPDYFPGDGIVRRHFGSWTNGLTEVLNRAWPSWVECLTAIRALAADLGQPPSQMQYVERTRENAPPVYVVRHYFPTWDVALRTAGHDPDDCGPLVSDTDRYEHISWSAVRPTDTTSPFTCPLCQHSYSDASRFSHHLSGIHEDVYRTVLLDELTYLGNANDGDLTLQVLREQSTFSRSAFESVFGSWNEAVAAAGFDVTHHSYSDAEVIADIQRVSEEYCEGETPLIEEMERHGRFVGSTYADHFEGSFNLALEAAGFTPTVARNITREYLINEIHRVAAIVGRRPRLEDIDAHALCSSRPYFVYFDSWSCALEAAGFEPTNRKDLTPDMVVDAVEAVVEELGRIPTLDEFCDHSPYSKRVIYTHLGSWGEALRSAGYEPVVLRDIDADALLAEIDRLADEKGRAPTYTEMVEEGAYSIRPYRRCFGSWTAAVEEAGHEPIGHPRGEMHGSWKDECTTRSYYGPNWRTQRAYCIQRDGRECRICGKSELENGAEMSVHHITPRYMFLADTPRDEVDYEEMNGLDNLVALCRSCHGRFEGEWVGSTPDVFVQHAQGELAIVEQAVEAPTDGAIQTASV